MAWCYLPETDCPSAQEPVALILASCSQNPASTLAATSSGKNTRGKRLSQDSGPDISRQPQYGTICEPSTPDPSGAQSTPCLPDTHASRSAQPASEKGQTIPGTYGRTSPALLPSFGPDGSFLRTSQATYRLALIPCCETYGAWATRLRLAYSQRRKSVQAMNVSGSLSWPTPMAGTPAQNGNSAAGNSDFSRKAEELAQATWMTPRTVAGEYTRDGGAKGSERLTLEGQAAQMWLTPDTAGGGRAMPAGTSQTGKTPDGRKVTVGLENQATMWGTPRASDGEKGGPNMKFGAGGVPLPAQAATWPRPAAQNVKGSSPDSVTRADGKSRMDILHYLAEQGFSRPDQETPTHGATLSDLLRIWRPLRASVIALHGRATWRRLMKARGKRRLNPGFVEWLMGWPPGHALCDCSATEFAHYQRLMRFALSQQPMACGPWIWKPPVEATAMQLDMFSDALRTETDRLDSAESLARRAWDLG